MKSAEDLRNKFLEDSAKIVIKPVDLCKEDKEEKEIVKIDASGFFSNKEVIFRETYVEYGKKKIPYGDINAVSYLATSHSINFVPTGTKYNFKLISEKDEIDLSLKKEEWGKIISMSKQFIEPLLIQKILKQIFEKNEEYTIDKVTLNKKGYSRDKFFGGIDQVLWRDNIFLPEYSSGNVLLFKEKDGRGKTFTQILMSVENSVLLPELIEACVTYSNYYEG